MILSQNIFPNTSLALDYVIDSYGWKRLVHRSFIDLLSLFTEQNAGT